MRIKPKQFQRAIKNETGKFEQYLLDLIDRKNFQNKNLLDYAEYVLQYRKDDQSYGLPFLLYSKISDAAPELMFLLLYRIKYRKDFFSKEDETSNSVHRRMLGITTLFLWFGKGESLKDHSKLLNNIWAAASTLSKERFWSSEVVQRASINGVLLSFPSFNSQSEGSLKRISGYTLNEKGGVLTRYKKETKDCYNPFIERAIHNKDFLLYAQRNFIEDYFHQNQYRQEDTNLPFDWDHISPNRFVYKKTKIPNVIREWYQTIGNFRAWPYALNRMDSDNAPGLKLNPLNKKYYVDDLDGLSKTRQKWQIFISNTHLISYHNEIGTKLLEWSFCESAWAKCDVELHNIRTEWKEVIQLIVRRNILVLKKWYDELHIDQLRDGDKIDFSNHLKSLNWNKITPKTKNIDEIFDLEEQENWISPSFSISGSKLYFYITFSPDELLHEQGLKFGIYEERPRTLIAQFENRKDYNFDQTNHAYIESNFTLISGNVKSIETLFCDIRNWVQKLSRKKIQRNELIVRFDSSIRFKFN
jgi:hypothetical protein